MLYDIIAILAGSFPSGGKESEKARPSRIWLGLITCSDDKLKASGLLLITAAIFWTVRSNSRLVSLLTAMYRRDHFTILTIDSIDPTR